MCINAISTSFTVNNVEKKLEQEELKAIEQAEKAATNVLATPEKNTYQIDKEAKKLERQRKRRIEEIEGLIEQLEETIENNNTLLCEPEIFQDHERVLKINEENEKAKLQLDELLEEWSELAE